MDEFLQIIGVIAVLAFIAAVPVLIFVATTGHFPWS